MGIADKDPLCTNKHPNNPGQRTESTIKHRHRDDLYAPSAGCPIRIMRGAGAQPITHDIQ